MDHKILFISNFIKIFIGYTMELLLVYIMLSYFL